MENIERQKTYYAEIIEEHRKLLAKMRKASEKMLDKIVEENSEPQPQETSEKTSSNQVKDSESAANMVIKISNIILKILPLEQKIAAIDPEKENDLDEEDEEFDITDIEIVEAHLEHLKSTVPGYKNNNAGETEFLNSPSSCGIAKQSAQDSTAFAS